MNLITDPSKWVDNEGNRPPIWWNPTTSRYEVLIDYEIIPEGVFSIESDPAGAGDTIHFSFNITAFQGPPGQDGYLNVVAGGSTVVFSQLISGATSGTVDIACVPGTTYKIIITNGSSSTGTVNFYDFTATITPVVVITRRPFLVYELDKGWTFDGMYIPHFIELNWYFGDDPVHYHSTQKVRIHGLSRGYCQLTLSVNGMQTDYDPDFTEPQWIDLPRNPRLLEMELKPSTNYVDTANRGLGLQLKFEGRNTDISRPEPQHALQVLVLQSTPPGTGHRAN